MEKITTCTSYVYINDTHSSGHIPLQMLHTPLYISTPYSNITIASLAVARSALGVEKHCGSNYALFYMCCVYLEGGVWCVATQTALFGSASAQLPSGQCFNYPHATTHFDHALHTNNAAPEGPKGRILYLVTDSAIWPKL